MFRGSAARMAEFSGVDYGDLGNAGRWNRSKMSTAYLTAMPRKTIRALAGFDPQGGTYFLARNLSVPEELLAQVFPEADAWCLVLPAAQTTRVLLTL